MVEVPYATDLVNDFKPQTANARYKCIHFYLTCTFTAASLSRMALENVTFARTSNGSNSYGHISQTSELLRFMSGFLLRVNSAATQLYGEYLFQHPRTLSSRCTSHCSLGNGRASCTTPTEFQLKNSDVAQKNKSFTLHIGCSEE